MLLKALEKHIPSAKLLLEENLSPLSYDAAGHWNRIDPDAFEFICVYGLSGTLYGLARAWLDEDPKRRLVFVEDQASSLSHLLEDDDAILLLNDHRVKIYFLESSLQIELIAKKVAWQAVFRKISTLLLNEGEMGIRFRERLGTFHLAAHLLLSEASDWGCSAMKNARSNHLSGRMFRSIKGLQGKFKNIPAVIVGAGPSLEKNGHLLSLLENKALIFAGGSALNALEAEPHFAASIDKEAPYRQFKAHSFSQAPFLYQSRMNPENFSLVHGEALLMPDGNSQAINWIQGEENLFNGGWTVGNFLTAAAVLFGCNPVIFVGMDLCYRKGKKYAHLESSIPEGLIQSLDRNGMAVWTQRDWLMAARWTVQIAEQNPDRLFIDATEGGLGFGSPILSDSLLNAIADHLKAERDLRGEVHAAIQSLPFDFPSGRWDEWDESLRSCKKLCETLSSFASFECEKLLGEIAYHKLLNPLWEVWRPVFERELDIDPQPLSHLDKLKLHKGLFFQQVLQEHIHG